MDMKTLSVSKGKLAVGIGAFVLGALTSILIIPPSASMSPSCPSESILAKKLSLLASRVPGFRIISIKPFANNLCQVVAEAMEQKNAFLVSSDGKWVFTNAIDTATGKDVIGLQNRAYQEALVKQREQALTKTNLDKYVAYIYYNGKSYYDNPPKYDHYIYFITDPKCPFCHDTEKVLMDWANKRNVAVKVIVLPLPIHPGSFETSVGLYCNKKGLNSLYQAYNSQPLSQCQAGTQYENMIRKDIMPKILGTPTFIGENGKIIPGMVTNETQFDALINTK